MLEKSILTIALILTALFTTNAQTLKITDVKCPDDRMYNEIVAKALGKDVKIAIYDSNISVQLPGQNDITYLRSMSDDVYLGTFHETEHEVWTLNVTINKTLTILTSAEITLTIAEKEGKLRKISCVMTAKRF